MRLRPLASLALIAPLSAAAREVEVCATCEFTTIEAAAADPSVHKLRLGPGEHVTALDYTGPYLEIEGSPLDRSTVRCAGTATDTLHLRGGAVVLRGLDVQPCTFGRAIQLGSNTLANLHDVTVLSAASTAHTPGRAIFVGDSARLWLFDSSFLAQNAGTADGGHLFMATNSTLAAWNTTFTGGRAARGGSVTSGTGSNLHFEDCAFDNNRVETGDRFGGAIHHLGTKVEVWGTDFTDGAASQGAAIYSLGETVIGPGSSFTNHPSGMAIYSNARPMRVTGATFLNNTGGHVVLHRNPTNQVVSAPLTIRHSDFRTAQYTAVEYGYNQNNGSVLVEGSHFQGHSLNGTTALALTQASPITVRGNVFKANTITGSNTNGNAAVSFAGFSTILTIEHNRFCDNPPNIYDGGHLLFDKGGALIRRNVFYGAGFTKGMWDAVTRFENNTFVNVPRVAKHHGRNSGWSHDNLFVYSASTPAQLHLFDENSNNLQQSYNLLPSGVQLLSWTANDASTLVTDAANTLVTPPGSWSCEADFRPQFSSPAVNAGRPTATDFDGSRVDIGAFTYDDADGDGSPAALDCDDRNFFRTPGKVEACDGIDNNCVGGVDEASASDARTWYLDEDGDGFGTNAGAIKSCFRPPGRISRGGDCDDTRARVNPEHVEICDGLDNNCVGGVDEAAIDAKLWHVDNDNDGYGAITGALRSCAPIVGRIERGGDCLDNNGAVNPAAGEVCDGFDNDCDGKVDDDDPSLDLSSAPTFYRDNDGDGFGDPDFTLKRCVLTSGYANNDDDCDDSTPDRKPGAQEVCNTADDDCDGVVDEDAVGAPTWYPDLDGDGYGNLGDAVVFCAAPPRHVSLVGDCDDEDAGIGPEMQEVCNGFDDDCDGRVDEADSSLDLSTRTVFYADGDRDGFGDADQTALACALPDGYAPNPDDCDDSRLAANPGATELCNGLDDDCDGEVDEGGAAPTPWFADDDNDGFGAGEARLACEPPARHVADDGDCDDTDPNRHPTAFEACNGVDDDCDGSIDNDLVEQDWHPDADGDGFGDPAGAPVSACEPPVGYVPNADDCDDTRVAVSPRAIEVCNSLDDDCDGEVDEGGAAPGRWYLDADGDGYGDVEAVACEAPPDHVRQRFDCDDDDAARNPGATELCNAIDDDCDGWIDEDLEGCVDTGPDDSGDTDSDDTDDTDGSDDSDVPTPIEPGITLLSGGAGCACDSAPNPAVGLPFGLLALLGLQRRRRA